MNERSHHKQAHWKGGISGDELDKIMAKPTVFDWEILDPRGRHIWYITGQTPEQAKSTAVWYCVQKNKKGWTLVKIVYQRGSREWLLIGKAISAELYGKDQIKGRRKAARYRSQLNALLRKQE